MSLSHTLRQANADLAQACLDQPFVRGIGDGSLPRRRFAWCSSIHHLQCHAGCPETWPADDVTVEPGRGLTRCWN